MVLVGAGSVMTHYPHEEYIGARRTLNGCEQVCMGPCAACGQPVWALMAEPVRDEPVYHRSSRRCLDRMRVNRWRFRQ